METKYTPGPWNLGDKMHEHSDGVVWSVPVWSHNGPEWGKMAAEGLAPTRDMARANAALIAAAPELAEAAQLTLQLLDGLTPEQFERGEDKPAREALRAALQKAGIA